MGAALVSLSACKEKKESTEIIVSKPKQEVPKGPVKQEDRHEETQVSWVGSTYKVVVDQKADSALAKVSVGNQKYFDNRITVTVLRKDGSEFFKRSFTKGDFSAFVKSDMLKASTLLSIIYVEAKENELSFIASVGSPDSQSDEYIPINMNLSRTGTVSCALRPLDEVGEMGD